jgi:hypothetical protein
MYPLDSPGVDISITDAGYSGTAGEGTVPLIIIGTHEYKTQPNGADIALGTLPENANKMYTITSQRELAQTFGNPVFYAKNGSSRHGYELNEFGLLAAYQYLGVANRAFVIRGAIDYSQLFPSLSAPRGEPMGGTYWLDTKTTAWGVFASNGNDVDASAWQSQSVTVIERDSDVEACVLTGLPSSAVGQVINASGKLVINGSTITLTVGDDMLEVANRIKSAGVPGITASVFQLSGVSRLLIRNTLSGGKIAIDGSTDSSIVADLGLSNGASSFFAPRATIGLDGDFALVITSNNDNELFQKRRAGGVGTINDPLSSSFWYKVGTQEWKASQPTRATGSNVPSASALGNKSITIATGTSPAAQITVTFSAAVNTVNAAADEINAEVARLLAIRDEANLEYVSPGSAKELTLRSIQATVSGSAIEIVNSIGGPVLLSSASGVLTALGLAASNPGLALNYAPHYKIPSGKPRGSVWVKTTEYNSGALWSVKVYNATTGTFSTIASPLYASDADADAVFGANKGIGTLYVRYNILGTAAAPVGSHEIRRWNGTTWEPLVYNYGATAPTTDPEEGTLWYNDNFRVDIMIADGDQWKGYKNYPGNIGTDPNGPILAGSAPTYQTTGKPLVQNDLWINTSDLENYPKIYRFQAVTRTWELINVRDSTTPFGIVFGDARWNADGSADGADDQVTMQFSDYCDPDAPDPRTFPDGILLFNTRYSSYNVKEWRPNYFNGEYGNTDLTMNGYNVGFSTFDAVPYAGRWVSAQPTQQIDGTPNFGRKSQRAVIVKSLAAAISSNEDIRSELVHFNLLAAPGYVELIDEMVLLNTDKKEVAFIVGDTPARLAPTGTAVTTWANPEFSMTSGNGEKGLVSSSPYLGVYYPWGLSTNVDGSEVLIPPSSIALNTLAYNDSVSYPWMAPAGATRGLVTNATAVGYLDSQENFKSVILSQGQRDVLYMNRINPIAYLPNRGLMVFGQKTRYATDGALTRINVARLINYMRYTLDNAAKPFLFEQNDAHTRDAVRIVFERQLGNLVTLRGLYDYLVVCDESNNTDDRIDRNELWIDIAIQPEKAIEFIYIPIRIVPTGEDMASLYTTRRNI